jgi:hypothetical protein
MEAVSDLMSPTPEADVFQRLPARPGMNPEAEDALIGLPKLPGSGKNTAAIDPYGEVKGHAILEGEKLGALL